MKLAIISKFKLASARRHQLPLMPNNYFVRNLNFKRSILETVIPCESGKSISLMSTHMDAFAQGSDTMQRQVAYIKNLLNSFDAEKRSWVIAGDFNLLPPGESYDLLPDDEERYFQKNSEMKLLYDNFLVYPKLSDIEPQTIQQWFTHFPNRQKAPDRIIDYYIVSKNISPIDYYVRQSDTLDISDHLPFIMEITTP